MITAIKTALRDHLLNIGYGQMDACELASGFNFDVKVGEKQKIDHKGERITVSAEEKDGEMKFRFSLASEGKQKQYAA
ncbi:hypothetical protein RYA05_01790 [Pseudomonas syringae pv. actinidiae]|uniref:hypothetical protein n=1 Tax=Pseudomonas viridiflava TaxID=33069 RepID=UPI0018E5D78E|nr:hypothetical protein [Pseudomonas viridiflava]MBI6727520.1 hypothetical protein [Pseudomonas viridiflava]MDU8350617.1 hypothetical protein [Pseudomonas syringae pv. actinidiae]